jgi:AraC family transcriptional regulator, activator of mtrCDE
MDVLSDVLNTLELKGTLYFRTLSTPPWGIKVPSYQRAARFHVVVRGRCHVGLEGGVSLMLEPGDMIVIPRGASHVLADSADTHAEPLDAVMQSGYSGEGVLVYGGSSDPTAKTELICGHFNFGEGADHPLLRALPDYLHVTADLRVRNAWLDEVMRLVMRLMFSETPGSAASVMRLSEVLFVEAIRACSEGDPTLQKVLDAMLDPRIGKALSLIHRHPGREWTVESLGREVAMSRSRFAVRFQEMMGCAPVTYLTDWRLQKARTLLLNSRLSIQQLASEVGYQSAAAFSRAFTQHFGKPPMTLRKEAV